jgi:hypothetical protein
LINGLVVGDDVLDPDRRTVADEPVVDDELALSEEVGRGLRPALHPDDMDQ